MYRKAQVLNLSERMQSDLFDHAGFTYDWYGNRPTSGYAVSIKGFGLICQYLPTSRQIAAWCDYCRRTYALDDLPENAIACFGGWKDTDSGLFYLDVSIVVADRAQAEVIGQNNGQLAIFDLDKLETIRLEPKPIIGE